MTCCTKSDNLIQSWPLNSTTTYSKEKKTLIYLEDKSLAKRNQTSKQVGMLTPRKYAFSVLNFKITKGKGTTVKNCFNTLFTANHFSLRSKTFYNCIIDRINNNTGEIIYLDTQAASRKRLL